METQLFETQLTNKNNFLYQFIRYLYKKSLSFINHWWFCTTCLSFIVISSIPRISVAVDIFVTFCLYIDTIDNNVNSVKTFDKTSSLIANDLMHYSFGRSLSDFFIIFLLRSYALFKCFAYKYQKTDHKLPFTIAIYAAAISSLFITIKLSFLEKAKNKEVLIFSLVYVWGCVVLFFFFRRKAPFNFKVEDEEIPFESLNYEAKVGSNFLGNDIFNEKLKLLVNKNEYKNQCDIFSEKRQKTISVEGISVSYHTLSTTSNLKEFDLILVESLLPSAFYWQDLEQKLAKIFRKLVIIKPHQLCSNGCKKPNVSQKLSEREKTPETAEIADKFGKKTNYKNLYCLCVENAFLFDENFYINALGKIIEKQKLHNVMLLAHSLEARNVLAFAEKNSEKVCSVVLVNPVKALPRFLRSLMKTKLEENTIQRLVKAEFKRLLCCRKIRDFNERYQILKLLSSFEDNHFYDRNEIKRIISTKRVSIIYERQAPFVTKEDIDYFSKFGEKNFNLLPLQNKSNVTNLSNDFLLLMTSFLLKL